MKRREIVKASLGAGILGSLAPLAGCEATSKTDNTLKSANGPLVISTWDHGVPANNRAWEILSQDGSSLDAAEQGVRVVESDPNVRTVGIGSYPDREGRVTLDACIMDGASGQCGSVAFLQDIENPISVARLVMEKTPHAMIVGAGAKQFALTNGFEVKELLSQQSKEEYEEWLKTYEYKPVINIENHDTIGLLTLDANGDIAGSCTTSGAAYKMHGRVGDSPIIGAGLFVDNEIGAACATGLGEAVIRSAGSAMVVEAMRNGATPEEACQHIVERIIKKEKNLENLQVGFLALRKDGSYGAYAIYQGFTYAFKTSSEEGLVDTKSKFKEVVT